MSEMEAAETVLALADGKMSQIAFANFLREHME